MGFWSPPDGDRVGVGRRTAEEAAEQEQSLPAAAL